MGNFFENLNDLFSTWAKGLQDSQKQNQQNKGAGTSAPSFESVGSTLLDGIGDAVSSAWTGFLNKVQESNKQNIQAGNYTTNPETVHLESPFGNHDNLMEKATAKPEEPKKKNPWEFENPFNDPILDDMYAKTVFELDEADPDMKQGTGIMKDAYDLTTRYAMDVFASDELLPEKDKRDPLAIAEKGWRDALDGKKAEYAAFGKSDEELWAMLEEEGYETEKQHREKQNQGIIAAAEALRDKNEPTWRMGTEQEQQEKENLAGAYERLPEILENVWQMGGMAYGLSDPNDAALYQQMMNSPNGKALIDRYMQGTASAEEVKRYGQTMAAEVRGGMVPKNMTLDEAEKYLSEQYPMYGLAKDTQGSMDAYSAAYGDIQGIARKIQESGVESLTDAEDRAWQDAISNGPEWLSGWLVDQQAGGMGGANLSQDQAEELAGFSAGRLRQMQDVAGLYTPYAVSPKNQAIWESYTRTPEGAARWAEDAQGTKDEQKAKDNLWLVERQSKYDEVASRPDFAETSKAKEDFHSGNDGFDQKYNVINNIGGAADRAAMLADIGGSSSYAVSLYNFMTPKEKGVFNSYAHAGAIDAANEYLDYLSYAINERMTKEGTERMRAMSESGVGGALVGSAVSVPLSIARGVGYLDQLVQNVAQAFTGRPVDRNSQANMIGKLADSAREGVQNQVDWNVNILGQDVDVFDFLYGTAMSGIDSFAAGQLGAALGGIASSAEKAQKLASWTGAAILGGGAAQSAMQDAYDRGANDGTALLLGAIAGANETLWEHWSIGNLIKHGQDVGKKTFAEEIKNALVEAGVNASEEFNTSLANGIAEYFLNHDDREVQKKADKYKQLGLSPEAALEKARGEFWASAVMDAAGGALMGGVFGSVENVQNRQNVNRVDQAVGSGFSSESMDTLYSLAESEGASDKAKKLARKFPKGKANAKQIGELFRELSNTMGRGIKEALHSMGVADIALQIGQETGAMDKAAAEAVTAMMQGENLNGEQVAAIAANPAAMKIVDALFSGENENGDTSSAADAAPSPQGEGLEPVQFEPMPGVEEAEAKRRQAASAGQTVTPEETAEEAPRQERKVPIRVKGQEESRNITGLGMDGTDVRIDTDAGESISLEDADVDAGEAAVIQAAAGMENQHEAAAMIAAWQNGPRLRHQDAGPAQNMGANPETQAEAEAEPAGQGAVMSPDKETARADEARQAQDFAMGFRAVYEAAQAGKTADGTQSIYADMLAPEARQAAEEAGRQTYEQAEAQAEERNAQEAQAAGYRTVKNAGADAVGVLFDRVRDGIKQGGERVKAMLQMLDWVGREFGMQYRVVDKLENDANGKYVKGTNIVYIALDAEEGAITKAASHEGFHFISQFSPDMAKTMTDFVLDKLRQVAGYDIDQRIREVMQQYRDQAGQELTPEAATEEIVADSMLDVIGTRENMEQLMKQSKSTAEKIKEWITNTYQKFKDILNRLAKGSPEVAALKDDVDYLGRISSMWQEGMRKAAEAYRHSQVGLYDSARADADVQQYTAAMKATTSEKEMLKGLDELINSLFVRGEMGWIKQNVQEMDESPENKAKWDEGLAKFKQALLDYKQGNIALSVALERNGLPVAPASMNAAISYAAQQYADVQVLMGETEGKYALKNKKDDYLLTSDEYRRTITSLEGATRGEGKNVVSIRGQGKMVVLGNMMVYTDKNGRPEHTIRLDEIYDSNNPDWLMDSNDIQQDLMKMGKEGKGFELQREFLESRLQEGSFRIDARGLYGATDRETGGRKTETTGTVRKRNRSDLSIQEGQGTEEGTENLKGLYSLPSRQRQEADAAEWVRDDAELYAQIRQDADSRAALELLSRLHRQTTGGGENALIQKGAYEKRLGDMAAKIKEDTGTAMSDREIRKGLRTIYGAMEQSGYNPGEILTFAREFYQRILEKAPGVLVEQDETTKEIIQALKTNAFKLTEDMKSEIQATYGSLGDWQRKNFGKLKISNNAKVTLADVWTETLNPKNPGVFTADATEADMPIILDAWLETANKKKFAGEFGANIGAMATDGAMNLMLDFYDIPGALKQKNEIRAEYQGRYYDQQKEMARLRATAREAVNNAKWMYEQRYNERIERDKATKAEREKKQGIINEIRKAVRPIKTMLMKGTDSRHIPEAMRGAMERMLDNLGGDRAIFDGQEAREIYMKLAKWAADSQLHDAAQAAAYDPDILEKLEWLEEHAGKSKALRSMTAEELEAVRDAVQNIYKMVTEENEIEVAGRKQKVADLAGQVMAEMKERKEASNNPVAAKLRQVGYKEMTPVYYARQVGGTLGKLMMDLIERESDVAFIIKDGKSAFDEAAEKYHLNDWIHDKNHLRFETSAGDTIELTKEMAMTLYAWWEREQRNKTQSAAHLRRGGFTYDRNDKDVRAMKGVNFTKSHVLSQADMNQIKNYLSEEQRAFVEAMVKYLSEDMAEKGNEASMKMFGWKKFGEKWYFPYPTDRNFRGQNSTDAKGQPDRQLKNMGASHALTENAMNPLKLGNFTDIWADHVDEMARYSVLAEKLDNLRRVTNYVVGGAENFDINTGIGEVIAPESVKKEIERALGQEGAHYLEQFLRDINGNNRSDERGLSDKWISLFKKGSVAANLSVVLQQPSAFVRAMSMVKARYFGKGLHEHGGFKATRERMYKNSGVANLKQWGGFDTNTGSGFQSTLLDSLKADSKIDRAMDFVDEWTGKGAEKADEITWVYMYSAIEAEIDDRTDYRRGTEEFDRAVARRFDEVMRFTQVYDSAFAKSEWMRSTSTMDKIATSFMAEPTLWINMMMDAGLDVNAKKPGAGKKAARALGVFVVGTFVNSLLQSVATAFRRKKEEGTTWIEKYLSELQGNFEDALSLEGIAGMIPLARDVVSLFQGYDVERADMAVIGNMIDAYRKIQKHIEKGDMPDFDEWMNLAGMAGNMFGVPVRNLYRDLSGIYANTFGGKSRPLSETSMRSLKYTALDNTSWLSFFNPWDASNAAYYDRMEQALIKGDMKQYEELRGYMEETKLVKPDSIDKGIKKEIKESVLGGLISDEKAMDMLKNHFGMDQQKAYYTVDSWQQTEKNKDTENYSYSREGALMAAVKAGQDVKEEMKKLTDNGYTEKELKSDMKSQIGKWYRSGEMTRQEAESKLQKYTGETDRDNMYWLFDKWDYMRKNGSDEGYGKYNTLYELIDTGRDMRQEVQRIVSHGVKPESVSSAITAKYKETYVSLYRSGKTAEAANLKAKLLNALEAAGLNRETKNKAIEYWLKDKQ